MIITTRDKQIDRAQAETWRELQLKKSGTYPPSRLVESDERLLYKVLPDGSWEGRRCFIVGGGPSLRGFDFSLLGAELTIGVNRAYERFDCTVMFSVDPQLHQWITEGALGAEARSRFQAFKGHKIWLYTTTRYDFPNDIRLLNCAGGSVLGDSLERGLGSGTNSGFAALNLAVCLGANPIYLLGFDMRGRDGKQDWWHDGYPERRNDSVYKRFKQDFESIAPELEHRGVRVVNLNPQSELRCFEFSKVRNKWI